MTKKQKVCFIIAVVFFVFALYTAIESGISAVQVSKYLKSPEYRDKEDEKLPGTKALGATFSMLAIAALWLVSGMCALISAFLSAVSTKAERKLFSVLSLVMLSLDIAIIICVFVSLI